MNKFESQSAAMAMMDYVEDVRKKRGISTQDIERKTAISRVTYYHYREGENTPTVDRFLRIADAVGLKVVLLPKVEVRQ